MGDFYLSQDICLDLGIIDSRFRTPGLHALRGDPHPPGQQAQHQVQCEDVGPNLRLEDPAGHAQQYAEWPPQGFPGINSNSESLQKEVCKDTKGRLLAACGCLLRTPPPPAPLEPPFLLKDSNVKQIEEWFLDYYAPHV